MGGAAYGMSEVRAGGTCTREASAQERATSWAGNSQTNRHFFFFCFLLALLRNKFLSTSQPLVARLIRDSVREVGGRMSAMSPAVLPDVTQT